MVVIAFLRTRLAGVVSSFLLVGIASMILIAMLGAFSRLCLIRVKTVGVQESTTQVFYDIGGGFNEKDSFRHRNPKGVFSRTLLIPRDVVSVRIDPGEHGLPIRFDSILIKPPGSWFFVDPDPSHVTTVNAAWKHGAPINGEFNGFSRILIPDPNQADPQVLIRDFRTIPQSSQSDFLRILCHPVCQFMIVFTMIGFIGWGVSRLFHLVRSAFSKLIGYYMRARSADWRVNPLRFPGIRNAFSVSILATLFFGLNLQRDNGMRYSVRFDLTSPASHSLTVFADSGSGFTPHTAQSRIIQPSVHRRTFRFDFFSLQPIERFRVDPLAGNGYARIENVRVRKGMGRWYPVDMSDWGVKDAILIEKPSSKTVEMLSTGDDPRVVSVPFLQFLESESIAIIFVRWSILAFFSFFVGLCLLSWLISWGLEKLQARKFLVLRRVTARIASVFRAFGSHVFMLVGVAAFLWVALFYLFYPGALCGDTVTNMRQAMMGSLSSGDPPLLQHGIRLLQLITCSQWPMLAIQLSLHLGGFLLLSLYFLRKGQVIGAWSLLGLSVFPHIVYPHGMVLKDLLISGLWINMLALSLHGSLASTRRSRVIYASIVALVGMFSVLSRDNAFLATPALAALVMVPFSKAPGQSAFPKSAWVVAAVVLVLLGYGFMRVSNAWLLGAVPNRDYSGEYFVNQILTSDLIGMSIRSDHDGVTSRLSPDEQHVFVGKYLNRPLFWIDDATFYSLFPDRRWIPWQWLESLINSPMTYVSHRLHLFSKLFFRNRDLQMLWIDAPSNAIHFREILEYGNCTIDTYLRPRSIGGARWFSRYRDFMVRYFTRYSDWFLTGVFLLVPWLYLLRSKSPTKYCPSMGAVRCSLSIALLYSVPNFLFVHHAETRYVYPALLMVFCSAMILVFCSGKPDTVD